MKKIIFNLLRQKLKGYNAKSYKVCFVAVLSLFFTFNCHAQSAKWINDSVKTQVKANTYIVVPNDVVNQNSGTFDNLGSIYLYGNWTNNAGNAAFVNSSPGMVSLRGDTQIIRGADPTLFYNLDLQGTGVKKLNINSMAEGVLSLNDRELNTQSFSMSVLSADTSAITRTTGYVSSIDSGYLARAMNTPLPYFFPVGSAIGSFRYRSVAIKPTSANPNSFSVRMANVDATTEGFNRAITDGTVGNINYKFYHRINRISGTDSAKISIYFDNVSDSTYFGITHWDNIPSNEWENTNSATIVNNVSPILSYISINNWNDYTEQPFALFNCIPSVAADSITVSNGAPCAGDTIVLMVNGGMLGTVASWHWYEGSCGGTALGTGDSIIVFPAGTITYFVRAEGACGTTPCISLLIKPDSIAPVNIGISASDTTICNGTSVTYTATPANGGSNPVYQWYLNGNPIGTDSSIYSNPAVSNGDSIYCVLTSSTACISGNPALSDTIIMIVNSIFTNTTTATICNGQSYSFGGTYYTTAGTYPHTFTSVSGCDSVVTLMLNVNPVYSVNNPQIICNGGLYVFNGHTYTTTGNYNDTLTTVNGCDSIIVTQLTVNPTYNNTATATICNGQSYSFGGTYYTTAGTYPHTFTSVSGCDSLVTLTLNVNPVYFVNNPQIICNGGLYVFNGHTYTTTGNYNDTLTTVNGCDSIIVTQLTVNPTYNNTATATICNGQSYNFGGINYTAAGTYPHAFTSVSGCDSIVTLTLNVNLTYNNTASAIICNGQSYSFGGTNYTTAGIYPHTFTSISGCDSIVTLMLNVNQTYNNTASATICNGQFYNFGGTNYSTAGTYPHTFTSVSGCDSIVTLTLNVNPTYNNTATVTICNGQSYNFGGTNYTTAGTFTHTFSSVAGCDSVVTLSLNVNPSVQASISISVSPSNAVCEGTEVTFTAMPVNGGTEPAYQWFINGTLAGAGNFMTRNSFSDNDVIHCIMTSSLTSCVTGSPAASNNISLQIHPSPDIFLNITNEKCLGANDGSIKLTVSSGTPPYAYSWNSGQITEDINSLSPGSYSIEVADAYGCKSQKAGVIEVATTACIYIPNIFSPNGDGKNDNLYVRGGGIKFLKFTIYDRWGNKVFETTDQNTGWDGNFNGLPMNAAVFVYYVKVELLNGSMIDEKGNVTLIR